jgi:pimeloyl-ACP methyl ester carboxylesterase
MDGTGELFRYLLEALPDEFDVKVVRYPTDRNLSYSQLMRFVDSATPVSEPYVLVAESFSTPLAILYAASNPPNLKGLVICAGFATSPAKGFARLIYSVLVPFFSRVPLPGFAAKLLLVGPKAPSSLVAAVRAAVSSVKPSVLSARARGVFVCDARAELDRVAAPIPYIQAEQDHLVHQSSLEEIRQIKPQTTVAIIPGPHLIFQREPHRTASVVSEFVRRLV